MNVREKIRRKVSQNRKPKIKNLQKRRRSKTSQKRNMTKDIPRVEVLHTQNRGPKTTQITFLVSVVPPQLTPIKNHTAYQNVELFVKAS